MMQSFDFLNFGNRSLGPITMPHNQEQHIPPLPFTHNRNPLNQARSSKACDSCREAHYNSKCQDCNEFLCETCVRAHNRVRLTRDHRIIEFSTGVANVPDNSTFREPSGINNAFGFSFTGMNGFLNDMNQETSQMSETATVASLGSIPTSPTSPATDNPQQQPIYNSQDAIRFGREWTERLIVQLNFAREEIGQTMDTLHQQIQMIEQHCYKQANEVSFIFGNFSYDSILSRCIAVVEKRQGELLKRIEEHKSHRCHNIQEKVDNLQEYLTKIVSVSDAIRDALQLNSPLEIKEKNQFASQELQDLRTRMLNLPPVEDAPAVSCVPLEPFVQNILNNLGSLVLTKNPNLLLMPDFQKARGRPVFGVPNPICVAPSNAPTRVIAKGHLCRPWGICTDRTGNLVVADRSHNRIIIFNPDGSICRVFGRYGSGAGDFNRPAGVTIDTLNRLIVVDKDNHRVQIFTLNGTFLLQFGEKGVNDGQFNYPWDAAVNSSGTIVITDTRNHRIQLFDSEGHFITKYGFDSQTSWKHFDSPRGVCFAPNGDIVVTDFNNHRVVIVDKRLTTTRHIGSEGSGPQHLMRPQGVICDDRGNILVADSRNNRIQIYQPNGNLIASLAEMGTEVGQVDRPSDITLTPEGRIVVVDFGNDRVQIF